MHSFHISLSNELPRDEFDIFMTKEVASFELPCIPEEKRDLKEYIRQQIEESRISIDSFFGFCSYNDPPGYKPRTSGFNEGRWVTSATGVFIKRFKVPSWREKKTGLYTNEADASLAVRACTGGVVLTAENRNKGGPLKEASRLGGRIINLNDFDPIKTSLRTFIIDYISRVQNSQEGNNW